MTIESGLPSWVELASRLLELPNLIAAAELDQSIAEHDLAVQEDRVQMEAPDAMIFVDKGEWRLAKNETERKSVIEHLRLYKQYVPLESNEGSQLEKRNDDYQTALIIYNEADAKYKNLVKEYDAIDRVLSFFTVRGK